MQALSIVVIGLSFLATSLSQQCNVSNGKTYCVTEDILDLISKRQANDNNSQRRRGAFFAFVKGSAFVSGQDIFQFTDVQTNYDNAFNPSTGIYTAPETGLYQIVLLIVGYNTGGVTYQLHRNKEIFYNGYASNSRFDSQGSTIIMELTKGDTVFIRHRTSSREQMTGARHSFFGGYML